MTAITTKSRQMRLDNCALNTPKRVQIAGNLRENACKDREAATPADAANAGLENNGKIRQIHPNTKLLGKYRVERFASELLAHWTKSFQGTVAKRYYEAAARIMPHLVP